MTNSKTIISYNGGSAGDLFTLSCNGRPLLGLTHARVVQPSTLKDYELLVQKGLPANLDEELLKIPYQFVSTHLLDEVADQDVYNIVIDDPEVQLYTIYRQMQIQKLRIKVNHEHIWFNTVKNYCLEKNYTSAAEYWFENAKKLWLDRMEYRINFDKVKKLNFNKLFTNEFVSDIQSQGWEHGLNMLTPNHNKWLRENGSFSYEKTIDIMRLKMSTMDWNQSEGWIEFMPKYVAN